jgi:diacylglycerol kinase family enzyme
MRDQKKITLIGNPIAGGGAMEKIRRAEGILQNKGFEVSLKITARKGDAETFARETASCPDTMVVVAGGDGTYNEVANGLVYSDTPMAILPLGTTSVLARELGIPLRTEDALAIALNGKIETVNIGKAEFFGVPGAATGPAVRHFLLMAGFGYDGDAVYGVNVKLKRISGQAAYIVSGLGVIAAYKPEIISVTASIGARSDAEDGLFRLHPDHVILNNGLLESNSYIAVISKAAAYGGDFSLTPDANLKSPFLHVFLHHKKKKIDLIKLLVAIITRKPMLLRDISYFRTSSISVSGDCRMQIDGDYIGRYSAKIDVVRDALKLIIPA